MTKLEMWEHTFKDDKSVLKNEMFLEELYKELTWKETKTLYVVLNWFRVHDVHRFRQYRTMVFFAGDIRTAYDIVINRFKKEMKMRGKRL